MRMNNKKIELNIIISLLGYNRLSLVRIKILMLEYHYARIVYKSEDICVVDLVDYTTVFLFT
jgi:hypothetical protein